MHWRASDHYDACERINFGGDFQSLDSDYGYLVSVIRAEIRMFEWMWEPGETAISLYQPSTVALRPT